MTKPTFWQKYEGVILLVWFSFLGFLMAVGGFAVGKWVWERL